MNKMSIDELQAISEELWDSWNAISNHRKIISELSTEQLVSAPYNVMYPLYKAGMKQKSSEKFIEDWVAFQLGVNKKTSSSYDKKNDEEGLDLGDLVAGDKLIPGKNNIELKVSFEGNNIGGGQLRFYEPLAGYLFMKAWSRDKVELFYLTKEELLNEMHERIKLPHQVTKAGVEKYYELFTSSQGSGKFKTGNNPVKIKVLEENVNNSRQDLIGWNFNAKTEPKLYKKFQTKYGYTFEQLKEKLNEI